MWVVDFRYAAIVLSRILTSHITRRMRSNKGSNFVVNCAN